MSDVIHYICVEVWEIIVQGLLSKRTVALLVPSRFTPVKVTVVLPSTEPNLGLILSSTGVVSEL